MQRSMEAGLLHEYLAVPLTDSGVADTAKCVHWNLKWGPQERGTAMRKDWQAYHSLQQLTGILSTAELGNGRKVWDSVVAFVETRQLAEVDIMPAKVQKSSFTTAQYLFQSEQRVPQSPAPAREEPSLVQPGAGTSSSGAGIHGFGR